MNNRFGVPEEVLRRIRERDVNCVYCNKKMIYPYTRENSADSATIEHFKEKGPFYWRDGLKEEDLAICCGSCNSRRGIMGLTDWFRTKYCVDKNINEKTVAEPVKKYLQMLRLQNTK